MDEIIKKEYGLAVKKDGVWEIIMWVDDHERLQTLALALERGHVSSVTGIKVVFRTITYTISDTTDEELIIM